MATRTAVAQWLADHLGTCDQTCNSTGCLWQGPQRHIRSFQSQGSECSERCGLQGNYGSGSLKDKKRTTHDGVLGAKGRQGHLIMCTGRRTTV